MTEQPPPATPAPHALAVVMRDYLSYGESGMADLKEAVHARGRKPVIGAFCRELHQILTGEAPVPTEVVNREFRRRAEEDAALGEAEAGDPVHYDDQQAYEALADLWEYLDLTPEGDPRTARTALKSRVEKRRSQLLWIDGDPVEALRTWMSWRSLALFGAGVVLCTASWAIREQTGVGFLRGLLLLLTLVGFVMASVGGGALWLRRVRYVDPDAFLPTGDRPGETRR